MSEILNLNTLCRCCHADGYFKSLNLPYVFNGNVEIYLDMFREAYGLDIKPPPMEASHTVCDQCILRLREAFKFKKQVVLCEAKFRQYCRNELAMHPDIKVEKIDDDDSVKSKIDIKLEVCYEDQDDGNNEGPTIFIESEPKTETEDVYKNEPMNKDDNEDENVNNELLKTQIDLKPKDESFPNKGKSSDVKKENTAPKKKTKRSLIIKKKVGKLMTYKCTTCEQTFDQLEAANDHVKTEHPKPFTCQTCNENFDYNSYRQHIDKRKCTKRADTRVYQCELCDKSYKTKSLLQEHVNTHTKQRVFECDLCGRSFLYKNAVKRHLDWHYSTQKKFQCEICGKKFNDKTNTNIHIKTVHEKVKSYNCQICQKAFTQNSKLKVHMILHTGISPYSCSVCGKTYASYGGLNRHKIFHIRQSNGPAKYTCSVCGLKFEHRGHYSTHVRKHSGQKPYQCPLCKADFTCPSSLKRHVENHSGVKRFACELCSKRFSNKSLLFRHQKNVHNPDKLYNRKSRVKCHVCNMRVHDIEKHMKCHENKTHKCDQCDRGYSEKNALNRHINQKHSNFSHNCTHCGKQYFKRGSLMTHYKIAHKVDMEIKDEMIQDGSYTSQNVMEC